nr:MAG TPA: hypothetical protein [Bacteriophage sp.]
MWRARVTHPKAKLIIGGVLTIEILEVLTCVYLGG